MLDVVARTILRSFSCAVRGIRRVWEDSETAQQILVELNTPWRNDGDLRWRRGSRGWELHGDRMPHVAAVPREPAAD